MIPLDVFGSESVAANLLQQVRWCGGVTCACCRSDRTIRNGRNGHFQQYLCTECDRTFNDKIGTIFDHSKIALRKWLFSIFAFLRFNTSCGIWELFRYIVTPISHGQLSRILGGWQQSIKCICRHLQAVVSEALVRSVVVVVLDERFK